jgi:hypothetical protein
LAQLDVLHLDFGIHQRCADPVCDVLFHVFGPV